MITELRIPYPDFKLGELIDPEEHDLNNLYIQNKINLLIDFANQVTGELPGKTVGAELMGMKPIPPFTQTKVQAFLETLVSRLQANTGSTGASLIGAPALNKLSGLTVEAQFASINTLLNTAFVGTSELKPDSVTNPKIANLAVSTEKIADGAVSEVKLANNSVSTVKIQNSSITDLKLSDGAVTRAKIVDRSVNTSKMEANSVDSTILANSSVTTAKVADKNVTSQKIADKAIRVEHLDPSLLETLPNAQLTQKVLKNESDIVDLKAKDEVQADTNFNLQKNIETVQGNVDGTNLNLRAHKDDYKYHIYYAVDTGTANAKAVTTPAIISGNDYPDGLCISFRNTVANTGAVTMSADGKIARSIVNPDNSSLSAGDMPANSIQTIRYNASRGSFQLVNKGGDKSPGVIDGFTGWTTPGSYTWTVPKGVTRIIAHCYGAGGGGGAGSPIGYGGWFGGGGGGGGFASYLIPVTPGKTIQVTVGAGGAGGVAVDGSTQAGTNGVDGGYSGIYLDGSIHPANGYFLAYGGKYGEKGDTGAWQYGGGGGSPEATGGQNGTQAPNAPSGKPYIPNGSWVNYKYYIKGYSGGTGTRGGGGYDGYSGSGGGGAGDGGPGKGGAKGSGGHGGSLSYLDYGDQQSNQTGGMWNFGVGSGGYGGSGVQVGFTINQASSPGGGGAGGVSFNGPSNLYLGHGGKGGDGKVMIKY